jgi:hypothetical protein
VAADVFQTSFVTGVLVLAADTDLCGLSCQEGEECCVGLHCRPRGLSPLRCWRSWGNFFIVGHMPMVEQSDQLEAGCSTSSHHRWGIAPRRQQQRTRDGEPRTWWWYLGITRPRGS